MADRDGRSSELVFCHACENEWLRSEHGLECPECHSDVVEIIDPSSDPREETTFHDNIAEVDEEPPPYASRTNTWGTTAPASGMWGTNSGAPDPDEDDIQHVQFGGRGHGGGGGGGISYSSTTYVRSGPGTTTHTTRVVNGADLFPQLLSSILGVTQPQQPHPHPQQQGQQGQQGYQQEYQQGAARSPLQEGPFRMGSPPRVQSSIRITTSGFGAGGTRTQNMPPDDIMGIFGSILQGIGGGHGGFPPGHPGHPGQPGQPPNPFGFLAQMLNPANARAGDAVFTNEALDRVISQLMEQHQGNAPGPATDAAINALPRRKLTKADLGDNGLVDCSICMESVEVGAEVTELPCKHWFHDDCVSPWLHEHDTCPQCRRGITPQEGDQNTPRATGQAPRHWQMSEAEFRAEAGLSSPTEENNPSQQPGSSNLSPSHSHDPAPDSSRTGSSGRRSGLGNLMDRLRHGSNSGSGGGNPGGSDPRGY